MEEEEEPRFRPFTPEETIRNEIRGFLFCEDENLSKVDILEYIEQRIVRLDPKKENVLNREIFGFIFEPKAQQKLDEINTQKLKGLSKKLYDEVFEDVNLN